MAINNFGNKHFTTQEQADMDAALSTIENILTGKSQNLSDEERTRYGSINEANKLLANKVMDYYNVAPQLASPDVNWTEYKADYATRQYADTRDLRLNNIQKMLSDMKIAHDYDNYQDSLTDYDFCKYKAGTNAVGFTEKAKELKQFFPNTGGGSTGGGSTQPTPPAPTI